MTGYISFIRHSTSTNWTPRLKIKRCLLMIHPCCCTAGNVVRLFCGRTQTVFWVCWWRWRTFLISVKTNMLIPINFPHWRVRLALVTRFRRGDGVIIYKACSRSDKASSGSKDVTFWSCPFNSLCVAAFPTAFLVLQDCYWWLRCLQRISLNTWNTLAF